MSATIIQLFGSTTPAGTPAPLVRSSPMHVRKLIGPLLTRMATH
jgi:hypothetical protein